MTPYSNLLLPKIRDNTIAIIKGNKKKKSFAILFLIFIVINKISYFKTYQHNKV